MVGVFGKISACANQSTCTALKVLSSECDEWRKISVFIPP